MTEVLEGETVTPAGDTGTPAGDTGVPAGDIAVAVVWFDGRTSAGVRGFLVLRGDGGLALIDAGSRPLGDEAISALQLRIAPPLGDSARSFHFGGAGRGETADLAGLRALERALGRGQRGAALAWLESHWSLALGLGLVMLLAILAGVKWGIPAAARVAAMSVPASAAQQVGAGTLALLDRTALEPSKLDDTRKAELRAGFSRLAAPYDHLRLTLHFRRGVGPNAFALPDGTVLMTDELVALAKDDRELLAVLAHEIGHVHHRHGLRMALEGAALSVLLAVLIGDASELGEVVAGLPGTLAQAQFSQSHETEADDFAFEAMMHAGLSPRHFATIMTRLQASQRGAPSADEAEPAKQQEGDAAQAPRGGRAAKVMRYLSSHPPTDERIRRFAAWAEGDEPSEPQGEQHGGPKTGP